jgi:Undecaprenyl-phosphate glucose phosphotransferase
MTTLVSRLPTHVVWMQGTLIAGLLRLCDGVVLVTAAILTHPAMWSPGVEFWSEFRWPELFLLLTGFLLMLQVFELFGLYGPPAASVASNLAVVRAHLIVSAALGVVALLMTTDQLLPIDWPFYWLSIALLGFLAARLGFREAVRWWPVAAYLTRNVVIVGDPALTVKLADQLVAANDPAVRLVGLFHDPQDGASPACPYPVLGGGAELANVARDTPIDEVIVALPWHADDRLASWMNWLRNIRSDVLLCPPVSSRASAKCVVEILAGMPLLKLVERPLSGWGYLLKEAEDRLLAAVLIVALAPVMLGIALAIRLDSKGPALFRQKRHGFNNNVIDVLKFRTMAVETSQAGTDVVDQATRNDPRVTRVGRWLRRTSLDELPQLFNVLKGQMSLVGPRPHAVAHNERYARVINAYLGRHRVKPGITGWAQVHGYRGETDTLEKMERRVQCDLFYIENWSLLLDQLILLRTIAVVLFGRNAY